MEAPTKDPTTGKVAEAPLEGPGAGPRTSSAAKTELKEMAAIMAAKDIFFMSIMNV